MPTWLAPRRPPLEIALPYKHYRLVRADGRPVERVDKHPFQLSRVFYNAHERFDAVRARVRRGAVER